MQLHELLNVDRDLYDEYKMSVHGDDSLGRWDLEFPSMADAMLFVQCWSDRVTSYNLTNPISDVHGTVVFTVAFGPVKKRQTDPRMFTTDGKEITDGGRYYNYYDCEWVTVEFGDSKYSTGVGNEYWDGWFTVRSDSGGRGRYTLNGERMSADMPAWAKK